MLVAELDEVTEDRHTRDFRKTLDLGDICAVEVANEEIHHRDSGNGDRLERHGGWKKVRG